MSNFSAASAATVALCLAYAAVAAPANGQSLKPPSKNAGTTALPTAAPEDTQLGEVIVTAQRRDERLQNVPVSVSVISGNALVQNQVRTLQDLGASVPGLVVTNSVNYGSAPLSIRGIGGANGGGNVFADEPVAVYVDDAYVSRLRLSTADLVDIGGIEVLRGPQGTLYGRNSTAGALLIRSAEPSRTLGGKASASVSSLDEYRFQGAITGPIDRAGNVLARVAGGFSDRGGWGSNRSGRQLNGGRDWQLRTFLRFTPTDDLKIDLIGDVSYSRTTPGTIAISNIGNLRDQNTNPTGSNVVFPYIARADLSDVVEHNRYDLNFRTFTRIRGNNLTGRVNWKLGTVALTAITNYREWQLRGSQDSDGTGIDPPTPAFVTGVVLDNIGSNSQNSHDSQYSQELRLASTGAGPFTWLVGGFLFTEKNVVNPITITNNLAGPGTAGTLVTFNSSQRTHSVAVFANASYALTDTLKFSLGGRYGEERKRFQNAQLVTVARQFDPPGPAFFAAGSVLTAPPFLSLRRKDDNFSPRAVLDWKAAPDTLLYASYSKGFKSGGFNAFRGNNVAFDPEHVNAYEAGVKTEFGPAVRLNLSAFRYDYTDLQVRTPVPSGGVGIESAQRARSQGGEAELTVVPMRGLRFDANVAVLDAKFRAGTLSAVQVPSYVFGTNPAVVPEDVTGNRLTRAPKLQFALSGRYNWDVGSDYKAVVQSSVRHQSRVFFLETQQQAPTFRGRAWEEVDARIGFGPRDDRWTFSLFAKNAFDNRHFSQVTAFFGLPNGALNEPRKFGAQFDVSF